MNKKSNINYLYRIGEVYGRLTLTGYSVIQEVNGYRRRFVEAQCQCGDVSTYVFDTVQRGGIRSCGCLQRDLLRLHPNAKKHGLRGHQLYKVWDGMKGRCYDPKNIGYQYYGGKGVTICDEWRYDFKKFYDWMMSNGWKKGLTIDRMKSTGNYEPSNCRVASQKAQRMNRDDLNLITAFGETKCARDWSLDKRCVVSYGGLRTRIYRDKADWPDVEKAITTPAGVRKQNKANRVDNRMIFAFGEEKSMAEWLKDSRCIVDENRLRNRLRKGWDAEKSMTTYERKLPIAV